MTDLSKICVTHSPLTDKIYLARFGKKPNEVLDKREAEADVVTAFVQHMMHDAPRGSRKIVRVHGQQYELKCSPIPDHRGHDDE